MAQDTTQTLPFSYTAIDAGGEVLPGAGERDALKSLSELEREADEAVAAASEALRMLEERGEADPELVASARQAHAAAQQARSAVKEALRGGAVASTGLQHMVHAAARDAGRSVGAAIVTAGATSAERQYELEHIAIAQESQERISRLSTHGITRETYGDWLEEIVVTAERPSPELKEQIYTTAQASPIVREEEAKVNALTPDERKAALTRHRENRMLIDTMLHDEKYEAYAGLLQRMQAHNMVGRGARGVLQEIHQNPHPTPEQLAALEGKVNGMIARESAVLKHILHDYIDNDRIPGYRAVLQQHFNDGHGGVDVEQMMQAYQKLSKADHQRINEIASQLAQPGAKLEDLLPEDQRLFVLSTMMAGANAGRAAEAIVQLARECALATERGEALSPQLAQLQDTLYNKEIPREERAKAVVSYMKEQTGISGNYKAIVQGAESFIAQLDKVPDARKQLESADYASSVVLAEYRKAMETKYLGGTNAPSAAVYNALAGAYAEQRMVELTSSRYSQEDRQKETALLNVVAVTASASLESAMGSGITSMLEGSEAGAKVAAAGAAAHLEEATGGLVSKETTKAVLTDLGTKAAAVSKKTQTAAALSSIEGATNAVMRNLNLSSFFEEELGRRGFDVDQTVRTLKSAGVITAEERSANWSTDAVQKLDRDGDGRLSKAEIDAALAAAKNAGEYQAIEQSFIARAQDAAKDAMAMTGAFGRAIHTQLDGLNTDATLRRELDTDRDGKVELSEVVAKLQTLGVTEVKDGKPLTIDDIRNLLNNKTPKQEQGPLIS